MASTAQNPPPPLTREEKLDARQTNAGITLTANFLNTIAVGLIVGGLITPEANGRDLGPIWVFALIVGAALSHVVGRLLVATLKPED